MKDNRNQKRQGSIKGINFFIMLISYHDINLWGTPLLTEVALFLVSICNIPKDKHNSMCDIVKPMMICSRKTLCRMRLLKGP